MKAIQIIKPENISYTSVSDPEIHSDEILVKPAFGGICGTDVHIYKGNFLGEYPVIPCHEFSGVVVQSPDKKSLFKIGDLLAIDPNIRCGTCRNCKSGRKNICSDYTAIGVTRPGGFAEYLAVPASNCFNITAHAAAAAFCEPLACVLYGQSRINFIQGSKVIIFGAGAIGLLHLQLALKNPDLDITVVDLDKNNLNIAELQGANQVILANSNIDLCLKSIAASGWDIAIDATGSTSALHTLFGHLNIGAQVLIFGVYPEGKNIDLSPYKIFRNDWSIRGSFTYNDEFRQAVRLLSDGEIKTDLLISLKIGLKDVPDVISRKADGKMPGKVLVDMT